MGSFSAGVQYNDWKGTAAADSLDRGGLTELLVEKGLITTSDFVVGVEAWIGENHGEGSVRPKVSVFAIEGRNGADSAAAWLRDNADPLDLKRISIDLTFEEFFGLFKRFDIVIGRRGLELDGREYRE